MTVWPLSTSWSWRDPSFIRLTLKLLNLSLEYCRDAFLQSVPAFIIPTNSSKLICPSWENAIMMKNWRDISERGDSASGQTYKCSIYLSFYIPKNNSISFFFTFFFGWNFGENLAVLDKIQQASLATNNVEKYSISFL